MNRVKVVIVLILMILLASPVAAEVFTVRDFDQAPDNENVSRDLARDTRLATIDLMEDLTAIHADSDGNEIFKVMPLPNELVAMMTQADIYEYAANTFEEMAPFVDEANMTKPGPNYFEFVIDGDSSWVNRNVSVWYIPEVGGTQGIMIPTWVLYISPPDMDGNAYSEHLLVAETPEELQAFMTAASVKLLIEDEDGMVDPVTLDIGYWRSFGIFDLGVAEEVDEEDAGEEAEE